MRVLVASVLTTNGFAPARVELTIRRSARGSRAARSVVIRTAIGTEPVSTNTDRMATGRGLVSVMTRKLATPHAATPRDMRVPTTSTAAAAMSDIRNAVRPPGESGGGGVAGASGGGAMVVTVKTLSTVQDSR